MGDSSPCSVTQARDFTEQSVTELLLAWRGGSAAAGEWLARRVFPELRRLARSTRRRERKPTTMQTTEVVNEAWIALVSGRQPRWKSRSHFFGIVARLMRQRLIQQARMKKRLKRQGGVRRVSLEQATRSHDALANALQVPVDRAGAQVDGALSPIDVLAVDQALAALGRADPLAERVVELRFFAGLTLDEAADQLGVGRATVARKWRSARAWLLHHLRK